jgi:polyhydroxyalkanoate synthase
MLGLPSADPVSPVADDARFVDPVWTASPTWDLVKEWYLAFTRHAQDMLYDTPGLSGKQRRRAAFWWRKWLNAAAPTKFLRSNPVAIRKAVETRGESLSRGLHNFLGDYHAGSVRMTDPDDFEVGCNLATTPGAVVFRNRLLEVLHYAPTRSSVHAEAVVIVTPWINKFYVLDLTERKSMVRFLLDQGLDVFITSWRNPDASMREVRFHDYLTEGIDVTVRTACRMSGARHVHAVGYCIGGTALAMYAAWANRHFAAEAVPVGTCTFLTTLTDSTSRVTSTCSSTRAASATFAVICSTATSSAGRKWPHPSASVDRRCSGPQRMRDQPSTASHRACGGSSPEFFRSG